MSAHTYICKECDPSRPCVCPDATDEPTMCPILAGDNNSEWTIDDTIVIARKFEGVQ